MICQQRFLPYWAAIARLAGNAPLIRQVADNANIFIERERVHSFGADIRLKTLLRIMFPKPGK